ncbi:hypothetical protein DITRI_Ditri19aG0133200 [Diplodiscus trichospermus]
MNEKGLIVGAVGSYSSSKSPANGRVAKSGSVNRFQILDSVLEEDELEILKPNALESNEEECIPPRKAWTASTGVADLMKSLKPRKKGPIDKGKKEKAGVLATEAKAITCSVSYESKMFFFSAIYGFINGGGRRNLWSHLNALTSLISQRPWLIAGDFNVIAHTDKSSNFNGYQVPNLDTKDFTECIQHLAVFDHVFPSPRFTWSNHQADNVIAKKLDRVLINDEWLVAFPNSRVEFIPPGESDHCPSLVQLCPAFFSTPKSFKFFNFWTRHPDFLAIVQWAWLEKVSGNPMEVLHRKLKRLKPCLKAFNKIHFADLPNKVNNKRIELENLQTLILSNLRSPADVEIGKVLEQKLHTLVTAEESFYRQKSRMQWIQDGDMNTKYFHRLAC